MWMQDANYTLTSGFDSYGKMTWNEASTWVKNYPFCDKVSNPKYQQHNCEQNVSSPIPFE
jgi:hypothetical protein